MKELFLIICSVWAGSIFAQEISTEDIVGVYREKSDDPVGGSTIIFLPDQTYIISYFGGAQRGTWKIENQKVRIMHHSEPQFVLYGRDLNTLEKGSKINFLVDPNNAVAVSLDANKKTTLKPVFNSNANCFDYPYVFTQEKDLIQLHAAQTLEDSTGNDPQGNQHFQVYHFNIFGAFNDLLLMNLSSEYTQKWSSEAVYKNDVLYIDEEDGIQKRPLESLNDEDLAFIKDFLSENLFPKRLQYGHEFFPHYENPSQEELKPYKRIDVLEISRERIEILEGSFFKVSCNED